MPETIADELLVNIRLKTEALEEGLAQMRSLLAKSSAQVERLSSAQAKAAEAAAQAQAKAAAEAASAAQKEAERLKAAYDAAYKALEQDATEAALAQAEALETAASKAQEAATRAAREQVVAEQDAQTARITAIRAAEAESKRASEEAARAAEEAAERTKQAQAQVAAAATAAFAGIVLAIRGAIEAANEYSSAMVGLKSLAEGTGQDFGDLQAAAEDLASDGLMTVADAAASLKNLLARGFSADEAVDMLERLKDAAAFGRQSSLSLGEAVRSASEGIKNENSILVDNAGVTKNVAVMWEEYAATIGKSAANLTQAEKRQAEYNGIMQETAYQVGDAARYAEAFAGKQAALEAATLRVNQALGASVQGALTPLLEAVTPLVDALAGWIERNPELTAGIVAATTAGVALTAVVAGAIPVVTGLAAAFGTLQASMGVVGAISLAIGALAAFAVACSNAKTPAEELAEELEGLKNEMQTLGETSASAEEAFAVLESGTATTEEIAAAKKALAAAIPDVVIGYDNEGNAILATNDILREHIELLRKEREEKLQSARETAKELTATAQMEEQAARDKLERLKEEREETKAYYEDLMNQRGLYRKFVETPEMLEGYRDEALDENLRKQAEAAQELEAAKLETSKRLQEQYALENELLGERDAATQLAMEHTMELATQQQLSGEEYLALLQQTLADEQQMAAYREEAAAAAREEAAAVEELASAQEAVDTAGSAAEQQRAAKQMRAYVEEIKNGTKGTATYQKAVEELTDAYGSLYPDVENNIDAISRLVGVEEETARAAVESARTAIDNLIAAQSAIIQSAEATAQAKAEAVSYIQVLSQLRNAMTGLLIDSSLPEISVPSVSTGGGGGGGGGSEKSRWEMELEELEHYAALGQDVTEQQIAAIRRILEEEKLSTEERWRLEEELYDKESALIEDKISLYKDLTNLTTEEAAQQAAALQYMLQTYALSTEERAALTEQLNETKKALDGDYLRDYIAHLEQILAAEQLNAAQRKNVLNEIMQARIQLMQREQEAMQESISAQISAIEAERDAQIAAIDKEIEALDKLLEQRKRLQQEEEDEDALRRLQESLKYEKDDYNRQQLEKQIEQKQKEIADREFEQSIQDQKDALKAEQDAIRERAQAQIEGLQAMAEQKTLWLETQYLQQQEYNALELEQQTAQNALLLEGQALYGEQSLEAQQALYGAQYGAGEEQNDAMVALTDEGQQRDVETLLSYEDDWSGAGHTLGGALESALQSHFDAIVAAAETMASQVVSIVANAMAQINSLRSAASSLQSMGGGTASSRSGGSARSTNVTINQTNNFSGSSPSPSAIRAATKGAAQTLLKY